MIHILCLIIYSRIIRKLLTIQINDFKELELHY